MDLSGKIVSTPLVVDSANFTAELPVVDTKQGLASPDFTDLVAAIKTAPQTLEKPVEKQNTTIDSFFAQSVFEPETLITDQTITAVADPVTKIGEADFPLKTPDTIQFQAPFANLPEPTLNLRQIKESPGQNSLEPIEKPLLADQSRQPAAPMPEQLKPADATVIAPPKPLAEADPVAKLAPTPAVDLAKTRQTEIQTKSPPPDVAKQNEPLILPKQQEPKYSEPPLITQNYATKTLEQKPDAASQLPQSKTLIPTAPQLIAQSALLETGLFLTPDIAQAQLETGRAGAFHAAGSTAMASPVDPASLNTARNVAQQIMVQIAKTAEPRIEIRLDPPELGRVVVTMVTSDNVVTATIAAERPEIVELMRRNAETLAAAFEKAGFGQANLSFQSGQNSNYPGDGKNAPDSETGQSQSEIHSNYDVKYLPGNRLDIRL